MALSGSVVTTAYKNRSVTVNWSASQSITNNTSTISWSLVGSGSASGYVKCGGFTVTINGSTVYSTSTDTRIQVYNGTTISSGSLTVAHASDGTKSFSISVSAAIYNYSVNCSGSGTFTLNTIARASQPTLSTVGEMGTDVTIYTNRVSSAFTHKIRYKFVDGLNVLIAENVATSYVWTIPVYLAHQIPNSMSGTGTIYLDTYSGSTLIGTKSVAFTTTVPDYVIPKIDNVELTDPDGYKDTYDAFVQYKSRLQVAVTASGAYSATISKVEVTAFEQTSAVNPYISNVITNGDALQLVTVKVTDSRGVSIATQKSFSVLDYSSPVINKLTASRCDEDGTSNDEGSYMNISYAAVIKDIGSLGINAKSMQIKYKIQDAEEWETATTIEEYESDDSIVVPADTEHMYTVLFSVSDSYTTVEQTWNVSTAFTLIDFNATGKGIGVGKVSEKDALEINLPTEVRKDMKFVDGAKLTGCVANNLTTTEEGFVLDARQGATLNNTLANIIECKTETNGTTIREYYKFANGLLINKITQTFTVSFSTAWGALYETSALTGANWLYPFISRPQVSLNTYGYGSWVETINASTTSLGTFYLCRPTNLANVSVSIWVTAVGRWK